MTTVVYRDGVIAADTRGYGGNKVPVGSKTKIRRMGDGTLLGCSSNTPGQSEAVMSWYMAGAAVAAAPTFPENSFRLLVVKPNGTAYLGENSFHLAGPLTAEYFAIGSGEEYAHGALMMGASAIEAVRIAIGLDVWSGGEVETLTHGVEAAQRSARAA